MRVERRKTWLGAALVAASTACASGVWAQSSPPLSYDWASKATAEEAGDRLLGPLAELYTNYGGAERSVGAWGMWSARFASDATPSAMPGVCEADVIEVWLIQTEQPGDNLTTPSRIYRIRVDKRYRPVGNIGHRAPNTDVPEAFWGRCAEETDGWAFHRADDAKSVWAAARIKSIIGDLARTDPQALRNLVDTCIEEDCEGAPRLILRAVAAEDWSTTISPCDASVEIADPFLEREFTGPYCLKAHITLREDPVSGEVEMLELTARLENWSRAGAFDPNVISVRLHQYGFVAD